MSEIVKIKTDDEILTDILCDLNVIAYRIDNLNQDGGCLSLIKAVDYIDEARNRIIEFKIIFKDKPYYE